MRSHTHILSRKSVKKFEKNWKIWKKNSVVAQISQKIRKKNWKKFKNLKKNLMIIENLLA